MCTSRIVFLCRVGDCPRQDIETLETSWEKSETKSSVKKDFFVFFFCPVSIVFCRGIRISLIMIFTGEDYEKLRLRLHVPRYPDIWISGCQRSGYLRSVYTYRIETFSAFTRLQISGCIIRGILAMCRRNTPMLFFWSSCMPSNSLPFFPLFLLMFVGWTTRSKICLVSSVIDYKRQR